jgi:hypothetical protein
MKAMLVCLMMAVPAANAVTIVTVSDITKTTATLNWDADGGGSYTVWRLQSGSYGQIYIPFATVTEPSLDVTNVDPGMWLNSYRVQGIGTAPAVSVPYLVINANGVWLEPGASYPTYISHSCGGVKVSEAATGISTDGLVTQANFYTNCPSGIRYRTRRYSALWEITYAVDGTIVSATRIGSECSWLSNAIADSACNLTADMSATYTNDAGLLGTANRLGWRAYWEPAN